MIDNLGGRPTKYKEEYARIAYELGLLGATDKQIADAFDVNTDTIYQWKLKHKGFSEALWASKIIADGKVAQALYKRACGFEYEEITFEKMNAVQDDSITNEQFKKRVVTKQVAPDTGAITLWLKNRQPDKWRDKQMVQFEHMSDDQLDRVIQELKNSINDQEAKD